MQTWPLQQIIDRVREQRKEEPPVEICDEELISAEEMERDPGMRKLGRHVLGIGIGHVSLKFLVPIRYT